MFQSEVRFPVTLYIDHDPAADDILPLWRAPAACEIKTAYVTVANAVAGSTENYFSLQLRNGGSAGTATTSISNKIGGTVGWTALTPTAFTMTSTGADLAAGDLVELDYDETGTGTFAAMVVQLDVVYGT